MEVRSNGRENDHRNLLKSLPGGHIVTAEEFKSGAIDTLFKVADRFGVPCVILAVVLYCVREAAIAMHGTVVEPMVKSHVEFLTTTSQTLKEMGKIQEQQAETLDELAHGQRKLNEAITSVIVSGTDAPKRN